MTNEIKTYSRKIDLRAFIEARPELAAIPHSVEPRGTTASGKDKFTAVFTVTNVKDAQIVKDAGFRHVVPAKEGSEPVTKSKPAPKAKSMSEKAMLADLTIKGWSARATDKEANEFAATNYQANAKWTKFTKRLLSTDATKAIRKAEAEARAKHKELTLPWSESGQRILPAKAFADYQKDMGEILDRWTEAVDQLVAVYDDLREEARAELGGLFDEGDYPSSAELQGKYVFDMELTALDVKGDFRVQMSDAEMKRLQDQITARTEARMATAMTDVYKRLHDVVSHMAERLKAYKPKTKDAGVENPFRDATLNNVRDIVDLLPKLNIANDPALDELAQEVTQNLLAADAKELRSDSTQRESVAQEAERIVGVMAGMM